MEKQKIFLYIICIFLAYFPMHSNAMSCMNFNNLNNEINMDDVKSKNFSREQFEEFKKVIAHQSGIISSMQPLSKRNRALKKSLNNKELLSWVMRNSLDMTRAFCIENKNASMQSVAIENFEYLLDAMEGV